MELFSQKELWEFLLANCGMLLSILGIYALIRLFIFGYKSQSNFDSEYLLLDDADFSNSDFTDGSFQDGSVQRAKFINANLTNVVFDNVDLTGSDFTGVILNNTKFINCIMSDVILDESKVKILNPNFN